MIKIQNVKQHNGKLVAEAAVVLVDYVKFREHVKVGDLVKDYYNGSSWEFGIVTKVDTKTNGRMGNAVVKFSNSESQRPSISQWQDLDGEMRNSNRVIKPILISLTEKIGVGDNYYNNKTQVIYKCESEEQSDGLTFAQIGRVCFKILSLQEHLSPEHLQMIVHGKLKEGKCLVECERVAKNGIEVLSNDAYKLNSDYYRIKLNPHITIYPVEENQNPYNLEIGKQYWFQYTGCKSDWFHGICTHFTQFGHPWVKSTNGSCHNGIISPGLYKVLHVSQGPPVEEKIYTREEVKEIAWKAWHQCMIYNLTTGEEDVDKNLPSLAEDIDQPAFKQWFEENIK